MTSEFVFPIDGDLLNDRDGEAVGRALYVDVRLRSDSPTLVVNGQAATREGEGYVVRLPLEGYRNTLAAVDAGGYETKAVVYRLRDAVGTYQFFVDDTIWMFRDIARQQATSRSIYDNAYLAFFRGLYERYGTLTHMHIYYATDGFTLDQMPARYKGEWRAAAEWLRLSFHAYADKPDFPHRNAGYEKTLRDYRLVTDQICRFAGEELLSPSTVPHWNEISVDGVRALRSQGCRILPGAWKSTQYPARIQEHVVTRDFWKDHDEDIITLWSNICLNRTPFAQIEPHLEAQKASPHTTGFLYMMIHEQYYHPDYVAYIPTFCEGIETAIRWAVGNGYRSAWLENVVLE